VLNNMTLAALKNSGKFVTDDGAETAAGERSMKELRESQVAVHDCRHVIRENQQKVVLAKWLPTNPRVLFSTSRHEASTSAPTGDSCSINRLAKPGSRSCWFLPELPEVLVLRIACWFCTKVATGEFSRKTSDA
jgi:ABC-type sugar transport system ATPase subunit